MDAEALGGPGRGEGVVVAVEAEEDAAEVPDAAEERDLDERDLGAGELATEDQVKALKGAVDAHCPMCATVAVKICPEITLVKKA